MVKNGTSKSVCVGTIPLVKLFTNIAVLAITAHVCILLILLYVSVILSVYSIFTASMILHKTITNMCETILLFNCFWNVVIKSNLNVSLSSDVQNNDEYHFVVVIPNNDMNIVNTINNNNYDKNQNTIRNYSCWKTTAKLLLHGALVISLV